MKPFRSFVIRYRRLFMILFVLSTALTAGLMISGCGVPAWLTSASSILLIVSSSFTSITSFIAGLTGNKALAGLLATVSAWITTVQNGISDLQNLITQYKASPSTSLLAEIETALAAVQANVKQDFSNLGLPASVLSVIAGVAGLAANLLMKWELAINGVKTASSSAELQAAVANISALADNLPQDEAEFRDSVNKILTTPTGDPETDAALAAAVKL